MIVPQRRMHRPQNRGMCRPRGPFQEKRVAAALEVTLPALLGSTQFVAGLTLKLQAEMEGHVSTERRFLWVGEQHQQSRQPLASTYL